MLAGEGSSTTRRGADDEAGRLDGGPGVALEEPDDGGHGDGLGTGGLTMRVTEEPRATSVPAGGIGLHREAGGDVGIAAWVGGAHDEPGGADGGHGVGLGQAVDLGH